MDIFNPIHVKPAVFPRLLAFGILIKTNAIVEDLKNKVLAFFIPSHGNMPHAVFWPNAMLDCVFDKRLDDDFQYPAGTYALLYIVVDFKLVWKSYLLNFYKIIDEFNFVLDKYVLIPLVKIYLFPVARCRQ